MTVEPLLLSMSKHPAPGYLFFGTRGSSKKQLAETFIRHILEHPMPLLLSAHPDFLQMSREPDSEIYSVESVREFVRALHSSSVKGKYRVALIDEADRLNSASVNALLKDVEESKRVIFVFITNAIEQLPATLRSRLVPIRCQPTVEDEKDMEASSQKEKQFAQELIQGMSQASTGEALATIERIAKICDANTDPQKTWETILWFTMKGLFKQTDLTPSKQKQISKGLLLAWNTLGTSLNPRLGLEYALVESEDTGESPAFFE